ncbi:MAG: TIGR04002 family protein [Acidaminococcus sp.]|nr:TIGR04002 family protein [Acidaminococcus sp.]MDY2738495.1 TIGR04002 family protein [Acidaminococcus sp.]
MHLRAAVINDLSGLGRCSLSADIAVLAAMGIEACPLPTAVLTAQTGYEGYRSVSFASHMEAYRCHWNALGIKFAGILSGYLASPEAARQTAEFVDTFHHPGVTYLCDPVLGDQGRVYDGFTEASIKSMRGLAEKADILTPNLTEFCLLTGTEMDAMMKEAATDKDALFAALTQKAAAFSQTDLVITGIPIKNKKSGRDICNLIISKGRIYPVTFPHLGGSYSGTAIFSRPYSLRHACTKRVSSPASIKQASSLQKASRLHKKSIHPVTQASITSLFSLSYVPQRRMVMIQHMRETRLRLLTLTGIFAALICLFTAYICHIPVGPNGGYLHFGDTFIYVAASLLPQPYALLAGAIGGGLADLLTAPMWAPATIIIKMLITLPFTSKAPTLLCRRNKIAPFLSWIISTIGYYLAEGLIFGSKTALLTSIIGSALQSGGSLIFYGLIVSVLDKSGVKAKGFLPLERSATHHGSNSLHV